MNIEKALKISTKLPLERRSIIHLLLINNTIKETINQALKPFDISMQQYNVLRILRGQKGEPANLSTINERMINKMSNTTRLVDKLIAKGLVKRAICETNRRKVEIIITKAGLIALEKMQEAVENAEKSLLANFEENELNKLNLLLDKF